VSAAPFAPLPWHSVPWHVEEGPAAVRCVEGWVVCHTSSDIDAEFIARAANCHDDLLKCAIILANLEQTSGGRTFPSPDNCKFARDVVAKALGRTPNEIGDGCE